MLPLAFLTQGVTRPRRRPPFFRTKKVAIVGCTHSHIFAPWHDPSWTIVAHTPLFRQIQTHPDWWMDLHGPQNYRTGKLWNPHYLQWLQQLQEPIFMQEDWPDVPMAVRFPRERLLAEFRPYFTNHVAWMIALAMTEEVAQIGLFGCEYKHALERGKQRGSCEYWLGRFEGTGGRVVLPPGCSLLADPKELYGYASHNEEGKLIEAYRMPKTKPIAAEAATLPAGLTLVDPAKPCPQALGAPPEGETIAWDRRTALALA